MNELLFGKILFKDKISTLLEDCKITPLICGQFKESDDSAIFHSIVESYKFLYCTQGEVVITCLNKEFNVKKGDVLLISPGLPYKVKDVAGDSLFYYVFFTVACPHNELYYSVFEGQQIMVIENYFPENFVDHFKKILGDALQAKEGSYLSLTHMLRKTIVDFYRKYSNENENIPVVGASSIIRQVNDYLDRNLSENVKVQDLCDNLYVSQSQLYKSIMRTFDMSPQNYIVHHKLSRSLLLLRHDHHSIQYISNSVGFSSIYHFSSSFKKKYGMSPKKFRDVNYT